jgi:GNAT superfamily N-acetyltransferase
MNAQTLEIRPFTPEAYEDVFDLYDRAWPDNVERRKTAFRWLHEGNPFARRDRSYLLGYKGGVLAGYWGRMPMRFYHRGLPVDTVFNQEALVDPAFRRQGIARALMEASTADEELYLSLWHNAKIVSLLESAGWSSVGQYRTRKKLYRMERLLSWKLRSTALGRTVGTPLNLVLRGIRSRRRSPTDVETESVNVFGPEVDAFFQEIVRDLPFIADRTSQVLNWRFGEVPHRNFRRLVARDGSTGEFRGYMVVEVTQLSDEELVRGDVVDFLVAPRDEAALGALLSEADRLFLREKVDFGVVLQTLPLYHEVLTHEGFRPARHPGVGSQLLFLDRRTKATPPPGNSYEDWFVTQGDSDGHLW